MSNVSMRLPRCPPSYVYFLYNVRFSESVRNTWINLLNKHNEPAPHQSQVEILLEDRKIDVV